MRQSCAVCLPVQAGSPVCQCLFSPGFGGLGAPADNGAGLLSIVGQGVFKSVASLPRSCQHP
jgi:hypothetical protein